MFFVQNKTKAISVLVLLAFVSISCSGGTGSEGDNAPTNDPEQSVESSPTVDLTMVAEDALRAEETEQAQINATQEYVETEAALQTATQEVIAQATDQAQPMAELVQDLFDQGYILDAQGTYYRLEDFSESYAAETTFDAAGVTRNYIAYFTGYSPRNFVIRADVAWENFAEDSNQVAGCGFVFATDFEANDPEEEPGLVWLSGLGRVHFSSFFNERYGDGGWPNGEAELMVVVEDYLVYAFVDGEFVTESFVSVELTGSDLAFTIVSGDSRGFGTRCTMTNIDLWELNAP